MLSDFAGLVKAGSREDRLLHSIKWERLPRHVAIIMDGNGRWAAQRGQPRIAGHRAGVEAARAAVDTGARLGLGALTLYAFSTENWKRPRYEIDALMRMLRRYLRLELDEIDKQNIRFQTIGRTGVLAKNVRAEIDRATERTALIGAGHMAYLGKYVVTELWIPSDTLMRWPPAISALASPDGHRR